MLLALLVLATGTVLLLVKLLLPRLLSAALESGLGLQVVRMHFRLLHMKFLRVELASGRGWRATVDEIALQVNSNFGSREGILQLILCGVRLSREEPAESAWPEARLGFDPGGGGVAGGGRRGELGRQASSAIARLFRVVEKVLLNKAVAAVALEVRQVELWTGEASSILTAKVLSLAKVPSAQVARLRCVDIRLRPRSWREEARGGTHVQVRSLRCPVMEVDLSQDSVTSDKLTIAAEVGGAVVDWAEYELGLSAFKLAKPEDDRPWLAEASDVFVAKEGVFSLDFGSVAFMQADGGKILSELTKLCLHAKRRTTSGASSASSGASRFSLGLASATLLIDGDDDGRVRVANVQLDSATIRKKDVLAAEGEKVVVSLKRVAFEEDGSRNATADIGLFKTDISSSDISAMVDMFRRTRKYRMNVTGDSPRKKAPPSPARTCANIKTVDCKLNFGDKHRSVVRIRFDKVFAESRSSGQAAAANSRSKLRVILSDCVITSETPLSFAVLERVDAIKLVFSPRTIQTIFKGPCHLHWHPDLHLSVWESIRQLTADLSQFEDTAAQTSPPTTSSGGIDSISLLLPDMSLKLHCDKTVASLQLSETVFVAARPTKEYYLKSAAVGAGLGSLSHPSVQVLTVNNLMASYREETSEMRHGCGMVGLERNDNPCLNVSADSCLLLLPFQVDLHRPMMVDVVGYYKWLKLLHLGERKRPRRGQSSPSGCLPDLLVYVRRMDLRVEDDVFEVRLRENYRLMEDEHNESLKRRECLQRKVEELRQSHSSFLSQAKVEELYSTLKRRDAELYTKRARGLRSKPRNVVPALVEVTVTNVKLFLLADPSLESMDSALRFMQEVDPKTTVPRDLLLVTHIFRWIRLQVEAITATLRDFELPLMELHDLRVWGPTLFAEEEPLETERYLQTLPSAFADGPWRIWRSLKSIKAYSNASLSCGTFSACLGPCLDPVLGQVTIAMSYLLGRRPKDPSPPLPWWDKVRFFTHGRASVHLKSCTFRFLTTMDPYNIGERVELCCHRYNITLNQLEELNLDCFDLDLFIRTTSEYEDCKPLHVPRLNLRVLLSWQTASGADPRDHFAVRLTSDRKAHGGAGGGSRVDSYADFRSSCFEVSVRAKTSEGRGEDDGDGGPGGREGADGDDETETDGEGCVSVEMLSSTVKWVEELMRSSVLSTTAPPIRKGRLFGCEEGWKKKTLLRHLARVTVEAFSVHRLELNYWTSILHAQGAQARADGGIMLQAIYRSTPRATPKESLIRRPSIEWTTESSECSLCDAVLLLQQSCGGDRRRVKIKKHFFLSIQRVHFKMELKTNEHLRKPMPQYFFIVKGANCAWTIPTRDLALLLYEDWWRDQKLREQLSRDVLLIKDEEDIRSQQSEQQPEGRRSNNQRVGRKKSRSVGKSSESGELSWAVIDAWNESGGGGGAGIGADPTVEDNSSSQLLQHDQKSQQHRLKAALLEDAIFESWIIKFENCQVLLKGRKDSCGHVIFCSPRAEVRRNVHRPQWSGDSALRKTSWTGTLTDLQYFATVSPQFSSNANNPGGDWSPTGPGRSRSPQECGGGGGDEEEEDDETEVDIPLCFVPIGCSDLSDAVGGAVSAQTGLQRIVSRCRCDFFYVFFDEEELPDDRIKGAYDKADDDKKDASSLFKESDSLHVNTFSLVHQDLYVSTNSVQYAVIMDVLNNLLLFVEPMALSRSESYLRLKYKLMLSNPKDLKRPIVQLQHSIKQLVHELRVKEKTLQQKRSSLVPMLNKEGVLLQEQAEVELAREVLRLRNQLTAKANELSVHVSCFHEESLLGQRAAKQMPRKKDDLWKRWMLSFSRAEWRLTECDGQLGIADVSVDNLSYSKSIMRDDSTEHLLEMSNLSVKNLLKNQAYVDVLLPTQLRNVPLDQQRSIRIFCKERPPVGGISVKDHFEINVVPLSIAVTQSFYKKIIEFCFPEDSSLSSSVAEASELEEEDGERKDEHHHQQQQAGLLMESLLLPSDDVEQMRERARLHKAFTYIKIPAVPICVSFKGDGRSHAKEAKAGGGRGRSKILDVEDFLLQVPPIEYHNQMWTWWDFLMAVKSQIRDSLLSQAIKKKLTLSVLTRRGSKRSLEGGSTGAQMAAAGKSEKEKSKMLLGDFS